MSEESFHSEHTGGWIEWFCAIEDHFFLLEVDEDFIQDPDNCSDLEEQFPNFSEAIEMILSVEAPDSNDLQDQKFLEVYAEATEIYGLIHSRYIQTPIGLAMMRERYLQGRFGYCPRVYCEKQKTLPIGLSEDPKTARVKIYCPRCREAYLPKKKCQDLDGAYFGKSFPQLLLLTYPDLAPNKYNVRDIEYKKFEPTVFGFKVHQQLDGTALQVIENQKENYQNNSNQTINIVSESNIENKNQEIKINLDNKQKKRKNRK